MPWDPDIARARSRSLAERLGYPELPASLPLLDDGPLRPVAEVEDRALTLAAVVACSYGLALATARSWLEGNDLDQQLTQAEAHFLDQLTEGRGESERPGVQRKVEALWALCWALTLAPDLDWSSACAEDLVHRIPDLKASGDPTPWRASTKLREVSEIRDELDAAYCLTWGLTESSLRGKEPEGNLDTSATWERRRALEWLVGDDWDDPDLST